MKGFQVKHLPQETHTFLSNSCYCRTKTSQDAMLYLRLQMRSWLFSRTSQVGTAAEGETFQPLCPGGGFLFIHRLHTEGSLSVGLQLEVSPSNQCAPLVESWGQISGWLSGAVSPFSLRLLGQLQPFRTSQQSQNRPELQDCFPPMAHSLGNENPHPPSPCQEPSRRFPCMSHWPN